MLTGQVCYEVLA